MSEAGTHAIGVRVRDPDGGERVVLADAVVVAAGAIESARLLMSSWRESNVGLASDWLGRGFMDHLSTRIGRFNPRDPRAFSKMFAPVLVRGAQHTPRMLPVPDVRQREGLLGAYGHWEVSLAPDSGFFLLREKLRSVQSGANAWPTMREIRRFAGAARDLAGLARGVVIDGRRPFPRDAQIHLRVDSEQRPDPESRITLTGGVDALGLPRVALTWKVSEVEKRTIVRTAQLLSAELERCGIGTLDPWENPFESRVEWGELNGDSFHMMGGCRMADSAEQGVVDRDSRVFGTDNVYIAGASVFPTGGMANPTLTLIALALRLADHLVTPN
jgi:choline dehydrogenase-like flavoprotein